MMVSLQISDGHIEVICEKCGGLLDRIDGARAHFDTAQFDGHVCPPKRYGGSVLGPLADVGKDK